MKSLLLIGGGGHCHSCIDVIEATGLYHIEGVVQPTPSLGLVLGHPIVGSDYDLPRLLKTTPLALVTVGQLTSPSPRIRLFDIVKTHEAELPIIISPKAHCSTHAVVGQGSIIMHGAIVNAGATIGVNSIINSQALIEHDSLVGPHCHISTGARVNGNVSIGRGSFIGSGVVVKEGVSIGDNVVIAAGQTVLRDVPSGVLVKEKNVEQTYDNRRSRRKP